MKAHELAKLGVPKHGAMQATFQVLGALREQGKTIEEIEAEIKHVVNNPEKYEEDEVWFDVANEILKYQSITPREEPISFNQWGTDIDETSIKQMKNACTLPIAEKAALMPDGHVGYGLPIGGVLGTDNCVIPYAVGVDIACRVKLSVFDISPGYLEGGHGKLKNALERETEFGMGAHFKKKREHAVMDDDWDFNGITRKNKDLAWSQLGSSGSGNHFVEFGVLTVQEEGTPLEKKKEYLALMSHSGSRGIGSKIANFYSKLAMSLRKELDKKLAQLAWLDLSTQEGKEYWDAMELMGKYAAANHDVIHRYIAKNLGAKVIWDIENHHNFAWKEEHDGKELIVHRKGATPAGKGVLGVIPGSMLEPAFVVIGKGNEDSLRSASHGAGRKMSRRAAKEKFTWSQAKKRLKERKVEVLSAGLDECPMAYKNIHDVMAAQTDLVRAIAKFQPRMVKMAPDGEKPED